MRRGMYHTTILIVLGLGGGLAAPVVAADAAVTYPGITRPCEERSLSFALSGLVREVMVKEGDRVTKDQPLMKLDDRLQRNALAQATLASDSTLRQKYSDAELAQKKVVLKRMQQLAEKGAASPTELEEADLGAQLADTRAQLTVEETQTNKLKMQAEATKVQLMTLTSTIDGFVERVGVKEGEMADPAQAQRPAVIVVKNDPLKVEVFLPTATVAKLSPGQEMQVCYPNEDKWQNAKIIFFDPVADAGSGLRKLHLELSNPKNRESGWQVNVRIPGQ